MSRIVILGAGESGAGAAVLAKKEGFDVFVSDMSKIKDKYKKMLDERNIEWEEGKHTEEKILNADEIIKSPGIPNEAPMIQKIIAKGIHIISEIEFAGRYTNSKMICITGSNGKTTTTSLIYHIFKEAGYDAGLAGNIGNSLALQVAEDPHEYYIIELSSFQLDNMYDFRANIAILLNITPDHLDRYGNCMQNYVDSKMRIIQNQTAQDSFIYWHDDPIISRELAKYDIKAVQYPFSELKEKGSIGYIEKGEYEIEKPTPFNMEQESLSLTGKHNIYNSLAAGIASNISGIKKEVIRQSLGDFPGVEHRLEKVAKVNGVQYVNDSKATNVDACWYALESMKTKVVLILGGKDKGNDYNEIKDLVKEKCSALVYLGADNAKLHAFFDGMGIPVRDTHSMPIEKGEYEIEKPTPFNMEQESLSLTGKHNIYNSLAAGIASNISGIKKEVIRQSLGDFPGVEHRLEKVAKVNGVQYVNDSKATNVDACWYALESMKTKVVLILGGKDKGNDYNEIKDLVKEKCSALVYLGADNAKLHAFFDGLGIPVRDTHSMPECVKACSELAKPGETVLLSPCCASFDLFKNMEDRGEQFKTLVRGL